MRKLLFLPVLALLALAIGSPISAATVTVKITATSFSPSKVTIKSGDYVTWKNTDTHNHQVVANNGTFVSKILAPGQTYTFRFLAAGTYRYHDGLKPSIAGTVVVTGPPPAVSIGASQPIVSFGTAIHITGVVSSGKTNEKVDVYSQPYPQGSFSQVTTVLTTAGGAYDYIVKPAILTSFQVRWRGIASQTVTIGVSPSISLTRNRFGVFFTRATASISLAGHFVYVERLTRFGQWVAIEKLKLGGRSGRLFKLHLARGTSRLRILMSTNQAGPGFVFGTSRTLAVRRR